MAFELPPLPYAYDALNPYMSEQTLQFHHDKHHQAYVTALNNLTKDTARTETGGTVEGVGDTPNRHDILTGTQPDGTAFPAGEDRTCSNWTSSTVGQAMVGHSDRRGLADTEPARSWNSSHVTRNGACSQAALVSTGGAGLFYCFAAN